MKTVLFLTIIALYSFQLELTTAVEIKSTKDPIQTRIAKSKECLQTRAAEIKPDIRSGPNGCKYWIDGINSIERKRMTYLDNILDACVKIENRPPGEVLPEEVIIKQEKFQASCDRFSMADCAGNLQNLEAIIASLPHPIAILLGRQVVAEVDPFEKTYTRWQKCIEELHVNEEY